MNRLSKERVFFWIWIPLLMMILALVYIDLTGVNQRLFLDLNHFFHHFPGPFFWENLTIFGDGLIVAVLFFPYIKKRPDVIWNAIFSMIIMILIVSFGKNFTQVSRPPGTLDHSMFYIIGKAYKSRSFPSGHTATIFCFTAIWIFSGMKNHHKTLLFIFAVCVGLSRIGVGAHWPADVAAGMIVGWISAYLGLLFGGLAKNYSKIHRIAIGILLSISSITLIFFYKNDYANTYTLQIIIGSVCLLLGAHQLWYLSAQKRLWPGFMNSKFENH